jgi:hypothetical protein
MAIVLPFSNDGASDQTVKTDAGLLRFRTYYMPLISSWLCDIADSVGNKLVSGLNLVTAVDNLIKGQGDTLYGYVLRVYGKNDAENDSPDSLGDTCIAVLFSPGEAVPDVYSS